MNAIQDDEPRTDCLARVGDDALTIPGAAILGLAQVGAGAEVHRIGAAILLTWQGTLVPVVDMAVETGKARSDVERGTLIVVRQPAPDGPKALLVDSVEEQGDAGTWSGAPVPDVVAAYAGQTMSVGETGTGIEDEVDPDLFLTVRSGGNAYLLPLADIARIEPYPERGLQPCGTGLAAVILDRLVRALPLFGCVPGSCPDQALVMIAQGGLQVALIVDGLGDVVEPPASPRLAWGRDGIVEARVVAGTAVGVVDVGHVLGDKPALRLAA